MDEDLRLGERQLAHTPIAPRRSDSMQAHALIRKSIIEGFFKPGERLVEKKLSEQLGVSRTPVREALAMLEAEGLIKSIPKRGAIVRTYSESEIEQIYDLRTVLEGHAARKAALSITTYEIERLHTTWRDMEECISGKWYSTPDRPKMVRYLVAKNDEFHKILVHASRNSLIEATLRSVVEVPLIFKAFFWYSQQQLKQSNGHHRKLIFAMEARDPHEAERVMIEHVNGARDVLLRMIKTDAVNGEIVKDDTKLLVSMSGQR